MTEFIPALELNRRFFSEVVQPILLDAFPDLLYDAALVGPGSEVRGFDTAMSMDHDWGLRVFIFLKEQDSNRKRQVGNLLSYKLPSNFAGHPVSHPESESFQICSLLFALDGPVKHHVILVTVRDF